MQAAVPASTPGLAQPSAPAQPSAFAQASAAAQPSAPAQVVVPAPADAGMSGLAVTGMVLGIVAIAGSFIPIINNFSFILAILAFVFAITGIVATRKRKKRGRGIAIAGLVLSIVSIAIVLITQSFFVALLDEMQDRLEHGSKPVATSTTGSSASAAASGSAASAAAPAEGSGAAQASGGADYSNMALGETVSLENGLSITVNEAEPGVTGFSGSKVTRVSVSYANNGTSNVPFNIYDWKAQDANGVLRNTTFDASQDEPLSSGQLAPGGTVTGNVYFDGDVVKVFYYDNILQSDSSIGWALK